MNYLFDLARLRCLIAGSLLLSVMGTSASAQTFDLEFGFQSTFTDSQLEVFDEVEATYESLITGYQPTVTGLTGALIDVRLSAIDGSRGIAGLGGGPGGSGRTSNGGFQFFPTQGTQTTGRFILDEADVDELEASSNGLFTVIFHEVGHALGFGSLWTDNNLVDINGQYIGLNGLLTFQEEFGPAGTLSVPTDGTSRFNAGHWNIDSVLGTDVMGPRIRLNQESPISQTTIASYADLGYATAATAVAVPEPSSAGLLALGGCLLLSRRRKSKSR